jgi:phosphoserine phosphatase
VDDPAGDPPLSDRPLPIPAGLVASLVLLRHGESEAIVEGRFQGRLETPLSPLGLRQAAAAGRRLADPSAPPRIPVPAGPPVEIVHSPLLRTRQTAEAVAAAFAERPGADRSSTPPLRPEPGLLELAQGEWEGLPVTEVTSRYAEILEAWRARPHEAHAPGGEPVAAAAVRARTALETAIARLAAADDGSVTGRLGTGGYPAAHGPDAPWTLLVGHDGIFKTLLLTLFGLPLEHFWMFPWGLTGISVVELADGRAVLRAHNLADHLGSLQASGGTSGPAETSSERQAADRERTGSL